MDRKPDRKPINVLVTLDEAYLPPARTMLYSLCANNPGETFRVYLLSSSVSRQAVDDLRRDLGRIGCELVTLDIDRKLFDAAPVSPRYPQEMYYRLLAPHMLLDSCERVLYLDPDVLVINPVRELVDVDLCGMAFAACAHTQKTEITHQINQVRLSTDTRYFNSGVLLMDVKRARACVDVAKMFDYVARHGDTLLLPDQDVFNSLYGGVTFEVDDAIWNYDARNFGTYLMRSKGEATLSWVMRNTAILHFCGRSKPWNAQYRYRFGVLYKHYQNLAERAFVQPACELERVR